MLVKRHHHHLLRHYNHESAVDRMSVNKRCIMGLRHKISLWTALYEQIIIGYFWRIVAHTCWQFDELIKARPSWTINHNSFLLHVSDQRLIIINRWFISQSNIYKPQVLYLFSIHLAGCGDVNRWCIQYTIELYHSIYAYNIMRLYTSINDALNDCYQYGILSILCRCYMTHVEYKI